MKIHQLPARTGLRWFKLGWQTFWRQPLALGLLFALLTASSLVVACMPTVGMAMSMALYPWLTLTLMVAAGQTSAGQRVRPTALLLAMPCSRKQHLGLLGLGALYILAGLCLLGLTALFDGGTLASTYVGKNAGMQALLNNSPSHRLLTVLLGVAALPLSLLLYPACGLVYWHGVSPIKAAFLSVATSLRNWRAFLLFSLVSIGSCLALLLGSFLVFMLIGLMTDMSALLVMAVTATVLFIVTASAVICSTAMLFSFRDCFAAPPAEPGSACELPRISQTAPADAG